jgi:hypothetical protein
LLFIALLALLKKKQLEQFAPLLFTKRATGSDSLPRSFQKEQQRAACSLALSKKSNRERLAPLLFTKRATGSHLPAADALQAVL